MRDKRTPKDVCGEAKLDRAQRRAVKIALKTTDSDAEKNLK